MVWLFVLFGGEDLGGGHSKIDVCNVDLCRTRVNLFKYL